MKRIALSAALLTACCAFAQSAPALEGRWLTESGNLEIEFVPCGAALCGNVVRVLANRSMSGPGEEMKPADPRPALGMTLLKDLRPAGDGELQGEIYNRENAKTYRVRITRAGESELVLRAYVGLPLFGKTQVWRRAAREGGTP